MPYYKTRLPGPITILCAGRTEGAWRVFGQEQTGIEAVYESSRLTWDEAKQPDGGEADLSFQPFIGSCHPQG